MFETYDDILTVKEVAKALRLGTSHVYKLLRSNKLNGYKEGKEWKIPRIALENYIRLKLNLKPII